jgi:electron transfer flavoprotein beta subunit
MGLDTVVLVKQVPDTTNVTEEAMKPDGTVNREALPAIMNPEDLNALEEALVIQEKLGGSITALTMGPPKAVEVLRECLFRGADRGILLSDKKFAASDTLATSYALMCAVKTLEHYDLILCGRQAIDGDTAQVGPQLAEKLGLNQLTNVLEITEVSLESITVKRGIESGFEVVQAELPLLLTVNAKANVPRPPKAKKVMALKHAVCGEGVSTGASARSGGSCLAQWDHASIGADEALCGLSGSATKVKKVESVVLKARDVRRVDNTEQGIGELVQELIADHILG